MQAPAPDEVNKEVKRADKVFHPVIIPNKIKQSLPFKTKEKEKPLSLKEILEKQSDALVPKLKSKNQKESEYLISRLKELQK